MKKIFSIICMTFLVCFSLTIQAQDSPPPEAQERTNFITKEAAQNANITVDDMTAQMRGEQPNYPNSPELNPNAGMLNQPENQVSTDDPISTTLPDKIIDLVGALEWYEYLFFIGFNILGYLSPFIPVLRKIDDTEIRVGAAAIVLILIFVNVDISQAWVMVLNFLISTKVYDLFFKLIKKTPEVATSTT